MSIKSISTRICSQCSSLACEATKPELDQPYPRVGIVRVVLDDDLANLFTADRATDECFAQQDH